VSPRANRRQPCAGLLDSQRETTETGGPRLARGDTHLPAAQVMPVWPGPSLPPDPTVVRHDLPWGQVMGQQAPGTPTTQAIKDAMQDCALGVVLRAPAPLGLGYIGFDEGPCFVGLHLWERVFGFHAPSVS